MNIKTTYSLFKQLEKDNLSLIYQGNFSNYVLGMATELIKQHSEGEKGFKSLRNKLSFLMIESFQNIVRYADNSRAEEVKLSQEMFITRNINETFYISTSNLIENEKIGFVKGKIDEINKLDKKGLKELYINILKNKKISKEGGAGLGFIEMVRKTKEKLDFDFQKLSKELSFFYFQIKLRSKHIELQQEQQELNITETKQIHKIISKENILLIHQGNFSQTAIAPVFSMVEDNIKKINLTKQKKVFHLMIEMLQNINKHGFIENNLRQGIFILGIKNNNYFISTGNFINKNAANKLNNYLDSLNSKTVEDLNTLYKKILINTDVPDDETGKLGLIDIARESINKMKYEFNKINEDLFFYTLVIEI